MEIATGIFPFSPIEDSESLSAGLSARSRSSGGLENMAIVELLESVAYLEPPRLNHDLYSAEFIHLVQSTLIRSPTDRPTPLQLSVSTTTPKHY